MRSSPGWDWVGEESVSGTFRCHDPPLHHSSSPLLPALARRVRIRGPHGGVEVEGFLSVVPDLKRVVVGLAGTGEAAVRAGLLLRIWIFGLGY
jgi:hypothetical protein